MQKPLVLLALLVVFSLSAYGQLEQTNQDKVPKNVVQLSAGFGGVIGAYNANYERQLVQFEGNSLIGLWGKVGLGAYGILFGPSGPYQHLSLGLLTGKKLSHFELSFGGARMFDKNGFEHNQDISDFHKEPAPEKSSYVSLSPVGSIGYRYQNPTGNIIFRTGLGYPEAVFIGLGAAF